ncbi:hypothetical protein J1614_006847 [Plenodomus biglobosus]|nr:hypothetical protein J1614_006847 [Plenodomus biglobosus]
MMGLRGGFMPTGQGGVPPFGGGGGVAGLTGPPGGFNLMPGGGGEPSLYMAGRGVGHAPGPILGLPSCPMSGPISSPPGPPSGAPPGPLTGPPPGTPPGPPLEPPPGKPSRPPPGPPPVPHAHPPGPPGLVFPGSSGISPPSAGAGAPITSPPSGRPNGPPGSTPPNGAPKSVSFAKTSAPPASAEPSRSPGKKGAGAKKGWFSSKSAGKQARADGKKQGRRSFGMAINSMRINISNHGGGSNVHIIRPGGKSKKGITAAGEGIAVGNGTPKDSQSPSGAMGPSGAPMHWGANANIQGVQRIQGPPNSNSNSNSQSQVRQPSSTTSHAAATPHNSKSKLRSMVPRPKDAKIMETTKYGNTSIETALRQNGNEPTAFGLGISGIFGQKGKQRGKNVSHGAKAQSPVGATPQKHKSKANSSLFSSRSGVGKKGIRVQMPSRKTASTSQRPAKPASQVPITDTELLDMVRDAKHPGWARLANMSAKERGIVVKDLVGRMKAWQAAHPERGVHIPPHVAGPKALAKTAKKQAKQQGRVEKRDIKAAKKDAKHQEPKKKTGIARPAVPKNNASNIVSSATPQHLKAQSVQSWNAMPARKPLQADIKGISPKFSQGKTPAHQACEDYMMSGALNPQVQRASVNQPDMQRPVGKAAPMKKSWFKTSAGLKPRVAILQGSSSVSMAKKPRAGIPRPVVPVKKTTAIMPRRGPGAKKGVLAMMSRKASKETRSGASSMAGKLDVRGVRAAQTGAHVCVLSAAKNRSMPQVPMRLRTAPQIQVRRPTAPRTSGPSRFALLGSSKKDVKVKDKPSKPTKPKKAEKPLSSLKIKTPRLVEIKNLGLPVLAPAKKAVRAKAIKAKAAKPGKKKVVVPKTVDCKKPSKSEHLRAAKARAKRTGKKK